MRQVFIATSLLLAALSSAALTLGRSRGAVLIGQPLDVRIQVGLEPGDDAAALCFDADVFHADNRVDAGRVSTLVEAAAAGQELSVRVRSAVPVDEPVVTVYLRAGCAQKFTRRYVFLADVAPEGAPAPVLAVRPAAASVASVPATATALVTPRAEPASAPPVRTPRAVVPAVVADTGEKPAVAARIAKAPRTEERPSKPAPVVRRKADAAPARARLRLDPLDLVAERDPTLRSSSELLTPPADNEQRRAEAAALWRAINAQPQDVLRDMQRMQALETDVRGLRELTTRNQASLVDLKEQLQKAQSQRYANGLVYGLVALLVAALALAVYFWRSSRSGAWSGRDWWSGRDSAGDVDGQAGPDADSLLSSLAQRGSARPAKVPVDVDLDVNEEMFASLKSPAAPAAVAAREPALPRLDPVDFVASIPGSPRAVNAEELFDIQQQADFFVSLGQYDQAIEVLKNHISDSSETSALAYLDLLKIYHKLDRKDDYTQLRADFNRVFNAQVPVWEAFSEESSGLEAYQKALSRIESLWPSPKVLEIIEESIFRKPGMVDGEAFNLEAYRELLLLHAIAKDVVEHASSDIEFEFSSSLGGPNLDSRPPQSRFSATNIQPLSASIPMVSSEQPPVRDLSVPRASPRLGLDIDLSDLPGPAFLEPEVSDGQSISGHNDGEPQAPSMIADLDLDLFDAATERDIAPRKPTRR